MVTWGILVCLQVPKFAGFCFGTLISFSLLYFRSLYPLNLKTLGKVIVLATAIFSYCIYFDVYPKIISALFSITVSLTFFCSNSLKKWALCQLFKFKEVFGNDSVAVILYIFSFSLVFFAGSILSASIGLTWDEAIEQETFLKSLMAINYGLQGRSEYYLLNAWQDKYYGIGFYFPSYFFHKAFAGPIASLYSLDLNSAIIISRHLAVFWVFSFSAFLVFRITYLITESLRFSFLLSITYFVFPYLLGYGMMNGKDAPFLAAWLLCTYFLIKLINQDLFNRSLSRRVAISLVISFAWLLTIRLSGVLFLVPCFVAFAILFLRNYQVGNLTLNDLLSYVKGEKLQNHFAFVAISILAIVMIVSLAYPVAWQSPYEIIEGINYMKRHPWGGCTLTLGECIRGQEPKPYYIPLWLAVKLPLFSIIGFLLLPASLYCSIKKGYLDKFISILILSVSTVIIILTLVYKKAVIYDELRQLLFLVGIFFIVGATSLYFLFRKISYSILILTFAIFISDDIKIYPYNYVWFNELSRFSSIDEKFETDHWGSSLRKLAQYLNKNPSDKFLKKCVYSEPSHLFKPFLDKNLYPCQNDSTEIGRQGVEPYIYASYIRGASKIPDGCELVHLERIHLTFSSSPITVGRIAYCQPLP